MPLDTFTGVIERGEGGEERREIRGKYMRVGNKSIGSIPPLSSNFSICYCFPH